MQEASSSVWAYLVNSILSFSSLEDHRRPSLSV
jgi:hypothetical protein